MHPLVASWYSSMRFFERQYYFMTFFNFSFKIEDKNSKLLNGQDDTTKYMGYDGF